MSRETTKGQHGVALPMTEMSALKELEAVIQEHGYLQGSLTYLDLRANKLLSLPVHIGNLPKLEKLDVRWNKLSSLPAWLQRLEQRGCTVFK